MIDPDVTGDQEVVHTSYPRRGLHLGEDQYLILEGLEDHIPETDDHPIEGEGLDPTLGTRSLDQD